MSDLPPLEGALGDALYLAAGGIKAEFSKVSVVSDRTIANLRHRIIAFLENVEDPEISVRELLEELRGEG